MNEKLTLYIMGKKGLSVLKALHQMCPGLLECVVGAEDASVSDDGVTAIKSFCARHKIAWRLRGAQEVLLSGYGMAVSWRWLIEAEPRRLIVFHDSLLPRYRGFNPLVTALINGDSETGVTALYATEQYDRGAIIAQRKMSVSYPARIQAAIDQISQCYVELACEVCSMMKSGCLPEGMPQDEAQASYSLWRDQEDYWVDWSRSAEEIARFVDAVGEPYEGARARLGDETVWIDQVKALPDVIIANRSVGKVIWIDENCPVVVCGIGLARVEVLKDETGKSLLPLKRFRVRFK